MVPRTWRPLPLAGVLLGLGLLVPAAADPVPAAVTHGTAQVEQHNGRCMLNVFRLSGVFHVGARTWHGVASGSTCTVAGGADHLIARAAFRFDGTSTDGVFAADCTASLTSTELVPGTEPGDPAVFVCRAQVNGSLPAPLVLVVKTHALPPQPPTSLRAGSFYGA